VAALAALGFALRLAGIGQTLVDDEIFTYDIVTRHGLFGVVDAVQATSITPPLHYLIAKAAIQLGSATEWVRAPSLVLSTATIPLLYVLGLRTVGRRAALLGAALFALSPFAVWYGDEARAYATLTFLVVVSTYSLLRALEADRRRYAWWALFVLASVGVLYTHYTGIFVLLAQAAWAVWRCVARLGRRRLIEVLGAHALVILGYVPWIPAYRDQHDNHVGILAINFLHPLTAQSAWENPVKLVVGQPFVPWDELLGTLGLVLLALAGAAALAGVAVVARQRGFEPSWPGPERLLVLLLALATPVGLMLYAIYDTSLYAPRNLLGSLPALCLLLGAVVAWLRPPWRALAAACLVLAVAVASVNGLGAGYRRPPYRDVAHYLDRAAGPRDGVLLLLAGRDPFGRDPAKRSLDLGLHRPHPFLVTGVAADRRGYRRVLDRAAKRRLLFVVVAAVPGVPEKVLQERLGPRFRLRSVHTFRAYAPIRVAVYATPADEQGRAAAAAGGSTRPSPIG
jgi:4-amino-4-deoxy-L-arabinose transferase-like glycosyltransferase